MITKKKDQNQKDQRFLHFLYFQRNCISIKSIVYIILFIFLFNSKFISTINDEIKENFNDQTKSNISF